MDRSNRGVWLAEDPARLRHMVMAEALAALVLLLAILMALAF